MPHFLGIAHPGGGCDPHFQTRPTFLYSAPTPKFRHPVFMRSENIVLTNTTTNKQMPPKTSNVLCYAITLGNTDNNTNVIFQGSYCQQWWWTAV